MSQGKTMKAIITIAGQLDPSLAKSINQATRQTSGLKQAMKVAGVIGGASLAAAGAAAVSATKKLYDLGTSFQDASNTIRIGTGATGDALKALNDDFKAVYKSVPGSMEDASQAIADYNTRLGLTGEPLQEISTQALQVSKLLGDDISGVIESSSKAFQQWNISAEDMTGEMDYVFKASQSTGTGFTDLMNDVKQFGPQLQDMGFSFKEATALIGQLDKAGVNTTEVLGAMKKSVTVMAEDGLSASDGLAQYSEAIKNAGSETEAVALASEVFGSRAGSTMAAAIRDGALSIDALTASLITSDETIGRAAEDTMTITDKFDLFKQTAEVALAPMAETVLDYATKAMEWLAPHMEDFINNTLPKIKEKIDEVRDAIKTGHEKIKEVIDFVKEHETLFETIAILIGGITTAIIAYNIAQNIASITAGIWSTVSGVATAATTAFGAAVAFLTSPITVVILAIAGLIAAGVAIYKNWDKIKEFAGKLKDKVTEKWSAMKDSIEEHGGGIKGVVGMLGDEIKRGWEARFEAMDKLTGGKMTAIKEGIEAHGGGIRGFFELLGDGIKISMEGTFNKLDELSGGRLSKILESIQGGFTSFKENIIGALDTLRTSVEESPFIQTIQTLWDDVKIIFEGVLDFLDNVFKGDWEGAWDAIKDTFSKIWETLPDFIKTSINAVIGLINKAFEKINSIHVDIPDWVPGLGGKSLGFNLPTIPELANGGFTKGVSIAGEAGTEAVISFKKSERDANLGYWAKAGELLGVDKNATNMLADNAKSGNSTTNNITFNPQITITGNADYDDTLAALRKAESEFVDYLIELGVVPEDTRKGFAYG